MDLSVYENHNDQRWRKFVTFWIIFIIGCVSAIAGFYKLWPSNLVLKSTRKFQILVVLIFTSFIFLNVLWKICCKKVANYGNSVQREINNSRRRTRTDLVSPTDSTNVTRGTPAVHSDVHVQIKRTFQRRWNYHLGLIYSIFWKYCKFKPMDWAAYGAYSSNNFKGSSWSVCIWASGYSVGNYQLLKGALNQWFAHTALKESYIAEAKLHRNKTKRHSVILAKLYKTCIDMLIRKTGSMWWKA